MAQSIIDGDAEAAEALAKQSIAAGIDPLDAINQGFVVGVNRYRARIRNHGHSCFLCEIVIRSQFHTTYEPEA
jgi:Predicted cobalamin binding protein